MIAIGTYVDNQEIVQYPVEYLAETWESFDHLYWFGSDAENCQILEKLIVNHTCKNKIKIINLEHKIKCPSDIGQAQNKCVEYMLIDSAADFIAYQQADLCLTAAGVSAINNFASNATITDELASRILTMAAIQNKLYCETEHNPIGCVVAHRSCNIAYAGGWTFNCWNGNNAGVNSYIGNRWCLLVNNAIKIEPVGLWKRYMLDLGYISIDAYYRKLINHAKIWPDYTWKNEFKELFDNDKAEGVKAAIKRACLHDMQGRPISMVSYADEYKVVIDRLGLLDDYNFVRSIYVQL